ncbi:MAG: PEP-CTERM sorting domain-containing protein [Acidobacteria bacterium]|nr:PEP-CTERM sorting domain-containing protein [Acidobacteriota bacterium]
MRHYSLPSLLFLFVFSTICHADPIGWSNDPQNPINPQTITLTTGQVVPFGVPGVICDHVCGRTTGDQIITSSRRYWLFAIPVTAGIFAAVIATRHHEQDSTPLSVMTNSGTTLTKPSDNHTIKVTSGTTAAAPVPEPKTIFSFGIGALLLIATSRFRRLKMLNSSR